MIRANENIFIQALESGVSKPSNTYIGDDGLKYCSKCHTKTQVKLEVLGQTRIINTNCECVRKKRGKEDAERERLKRLDRIKDLRNSAFPDATMQKMNFSNDDGKNYKLTGAMKKYVEHFDEFKKDGKGLLLWGNAGTGKTYAATCVVNALIDKEIPCYVTNFTRIINKLHSSFSERQEYLDDLNRYKLIAIDDLGIERTSEYVQEIVYEVIDSRYRAKLPAIITTNLRVGDLKNPQSAYQTRIYDRILEMCHPIEVSGNSRRRMKVSETYARTKEILGL